jgi:transposase
VEDRGDPAPAPPTRRPAAAAASPPKAELGGPGPHGGPVQRDAKARHHGLRLLVTPETILRWHRDIVRRHWAARSMRGKTGRPAARRNIQALVRRLARENPGWGYRRIHGELPGLGVKVAASTVWEILKASGIDPAWRQTGPTRSQILRSQAGAILASDFFTADLLDVTQAYVLAVIEHASRRIRILGVTLDRYRVQRQTRTACLINEYRLVA